MKKLLFLCLCLPIFANSYLSVEKLDDQRISIHYVNNKTTIDEVVDLTQEYPYVKIDQNEEMFSFFFGDDQFDLYLKNNEPMFITKKDI